MHAHMGNEVCSETIVIRSNAEWNAVVRRLRYDGERYSIVNEQRIEPTRLQCVEQDAGLFALVGASS